MFEYDIDHMKPLPEILRSAVGKKEMLTVIYNVLDGLESFGKGMVSLSFVARIFSIFSFHQRLMMWDLSLLQ